MPTFELGQDGHYGEETPLKAVESWLEHRAKAVAVESVLPK